MEFWQAIAHTEVEQLVPFAKLAEELGYAGVTSGDPFGTPEKIASPYPYTVDQKRWENAKTIIPDPLMQCAALAQVTTRLRFMTTCYVLPMREPFAAAKVIATVAVMSGNRLVLGVGIGWMGWAPRMQRAWRAAGRSGAPHLVAAANDLAHPDQVRALADAGATGVISMPLTWRGVSASERAQKRAAMETFAREVMARAG